MRLIMVAKTLESKESEEIGTKYNPPQAGNYMKMFEDELKEMPR